MSATNGGASSKQRLRFCILNLSLLLSLFSTNGTHLFAAPAENTKLPEQIKKLIEDQCAAWNRASLGEFMSYYLNAAETSYSSGGTVIHGFAALEERYKKKYGSSPETMGKLRFSKLEVMPLGQSKDIALVLGNWHLDREEGKVEGVFSLVLVRKGKDWKILHDHTSSIPR